MAIYACSDFHGCLNAYKKIKEFIKPEDKVYCLGDCGDRGSEPWDTIKAVLTDPQFIYIKGNHEDMLVKAAREIFNGEYMGDSSYYQRLLASNGGSETLEQLLGEESPERWIRQLAQLPTLINIENSNKQKISLTHAGYSSWKDDDTIPVSKELLWNRLHYFDNANLLSDTIIVHGHTPIVYLVADIEIEEPDEWIALKYANGKKYCIDQGTVFSGHSTLLNLDTFESIDFNLYD